jgi:hypothetical protein
MQQRSLRLAPLTTLALLLILALQAPPTAAQSKKQEPLLPATAMRTFEAALRTLAKEGRAESSQRLLDALVTLGLSEDRKNKLGQELERLLSKAKPPKSSRKTRALGSLRRALRSLERELADAQGPRREALARVLLLFDKQHAAANEALGHIAIEGVYFDPSVRTLEAERARIHEWMREVRDRKLEIHKSSAEDPLVREVYGREASVARWNNWVLRSAWTQHKAARALGEVVRSWFLMRALQGEGLGEPSALRPWNWVHFHSEGAYNRGIDFAISQGLGDAESAKASRAIGNWFGYRDGEVVHALAESDLEIALLYFKADSLPVPFLAAGQFNWIGLHYLGASMPGIVYSDSGRGKDARTVSTGPDDLERAEMQRMREAGAAGARMYLRWLVSRNEDPPLHTLLEDHIGKVLGDRMLKATFVYEYLQLRGGPEELIRPRAGVLRDLGKKGQREYLEAALGMKLEDFDKQWRAWMMPRSQGLLADLDPTPDPSAGKEGAEVLEELERIRSAAFKKARLRGEVYPLRIDIDLSRGCRLHARYLAKNPEQTRRLARRARGVSRPTRLHARGGPRRHLFGHRWRRRRHARRHSRLDGNLLSPHPAARAQRRAHRLGPRRRHRAPRSELDVRPTSARDPHLLAARRPEQRAAALSARAPQSGARCAAGRVRLPDHAHARPAQHQADRQGCRRRHDAALRRPRQRRQVRRLLRVEPFQTEQPRSRAALHLLSHPQGASVAGHPLHGYGQERGPRPRPRVELPHGPLKLTAAEQFGIQREIVCCESLATN